MSNDENDSSEFGRDYYQFGPYTHAVVLDRNDRDIPIAVKEGEDVVWMTMESAEALLKMLPQVLRDARRVHNAGNGEGPVATTPIRRELQV
jgi:hypothetical protein